MAEETPKKKKGVLDRFKAAKEEVVESVEEVVEAVSETIDEVQASVDALTGHEAAYTKDLVGDVWVVYKDGRKVYQNPVEANADRFIAAR